MNKSLQNKNYRSEWETPPDVFEKIQNAFTSVFLHDVAATPSNTKCGFVFKPGIDALNEGWGAPNGLWWCNPPFNKVEDFLKKAHGEFAKGCEGVMLVPSLQETKWFRKYITELNMPRLVWPKRISFLHPDTKKPCKGNVTGSVLVAFIKDKSTLLPIEGQPWVGNL